MRFLESADADERKAMTAVVESAVIEIRHEVMLMVRHMFGVQGVKTLRDEYPAAMYAEIYNVMAALVDKAYFDGRMHVHVPKGDDE